MIVHAKSPQAIDRERRRAPVDTPVVTNPRLQQKAGKWISEEEAKLVDLALVHYLKSTPMPAMRALRKRLKGSP